MTLALRDDLFDAQFVRALAYTAQGGADIGECCGTAARITKTDADLWHDEWLTTAKRVERQPDESAAGGYVVSARGACFRAANYYRTAGCTSRTRPPPCSGATTCWPSTGRAGARSS